LNSRWQAGRGGRGRADADARAGRKREDGTSGQDASMHPEVISGGAISVAVPSPSSPSVSPPPHPYVSAYSEKKNIRALRAPFIAPNFPLSRRRDIAHKSVPRPVPARVRNPPTRKSAALFLRVPPPPLPSPLFNISRQHFILFRRIDVNFFLSPRASGRCRRFRGRELAR